MTDEHHGEHHPEHNAHHAEHKPHHSQMPEIPKVDFKGVNVGSITGGFNDVIEILKLNKTVIDKVAGRDGEGIAVALIYLLIGALAVPLGAMILGISVPFIGTIRIGVVPALQSALGSAIMFCVSLYVTNLVAEKMFQGHAKFPQYFRVMGYAALVNVIGFITPVMALSLVAGVWWMVVNYVVLNHVHKLSSQNAALTIVVMLVVLYILNAVLTSFGFGSMSLGSSLSFSLR